MRLDLGEFISLLMVIHLMVDVLPINIGILVTNIFFITRKPVGCGFVVNGVSGSGYELLAMG